MSERVRRCNTPIDNAPLYVAVVDQCARCGGDIAGGVRYAYQWFHAECVEPFIIGILAERDAARARADALQAALVQAQVSVYDSNPVTWTTINTSTGGTVASGTISGNTITNTGDVFYPTNSNPYGLYSTLAVPTTITFQTKVSRGP